MLAVLAGFVILTLSSIHQFSNVLSPVPSILFTALPLIALHIVSGGHLGTLFRPYGFRALIRSILFGMVTLISSLAVALLVSQFISLEQNRVENILATADVFVLVVLLARTFIQLIGEEAVTILPLLAVVWFTTTKLRLSQRAGLVAGVVVSTALFASMHLPTYGWNVIQCFAVIGTARLILTWSYLRTGNLWVSFGAHLINDWSIFAVSYVGNHLPIGL